MFHRCGSFGRHAAPGGFRGFGGGPFGGFGPPFGGGGPFGRGGPGGRRGGFARFFAHGDLRLVLLALNAEQPRHGYDLIKAVEERVGGAYSPSPGVVYPTLTLLEEQGYIAPRPGEGTKKSYGITPEGQAFLDANRDAIDGLMSRMDETGRANAGSPPPQVVRAMENLRVALRLRMGREPLTREQAQAIAAAIDGAVSAIEQA